MPADILAEFGLEPGRVHLNHGSFGAVPRVVQTEQQRLRVRAEANPMRFHRVELPALVEQARAAGAEFLSVAADEIALVRNPTEAVATVLSALAGRRLLGPGATVLTSQQGYGAVAMAVQHWCQRTGASHGIIRLPAGAGDDDVVEAYRTTIRDTQHQGQVPRLVVVDQITSPTGALLPAAAVAEVAGEFGALTLVDAAHGPGQVPVEPGIADFWTGTFHKWAYAPRGSAALWVAEQHRDWVAPLTTSWNHGQPFPRPFDLHGTDDYSAWASLPVALGFWAEVGGPQLGPRATGLLDEALPIVSAVSGGTDAPVPGHPAPCLRLVPLPAGLADAPERADALYETLSERGAEVQPVAFDGRGYLRLSANVYNDLDDYRRLAAVLEGVLADGGSATRRDDGRRRTSVGR